MYKRRVSAVRDFPPGCGRFATEAFPEQNGVVSVCLNNLACQKETPTCANPSANGIDLHSPVVFHNIVGTPVEGCSISANHHASGFEANEKYLTPDRFSNGLEHTKVEPSRETSHNDEGLGTKDSHALMKELICPNYPPLRKVSAVRDFPPFCGRNAPACNKKAGSEVLTSVESGIVARESSGNDRKPGEGNVYMQVNSRGHTSSQNKAVSQESFGTDSTKPKQENMRANITQLQDDDRRLDAYLEKNISRLSGDKARIKYQVRGFEKSWNPDQTEALKEVRLAWGDTKDQTAKRWKVGLEGADRNFMGLKQNSRKRVGNPSLGIVAGWGGKGDDLENNEEPVSLNPARRSTLAVCPPPLSLLKGKGDENDVLGARNKVRETLRMFHAICRKLLQEEETKLKDQGNGVRRIDLLASKILKEKGMVVNMEKKILGPVPGIEIGDEFQYRVELTMVGLHRLIQGGIDYAKEGKHVFATSIVASGGYDDNMDNSDVLVYTGSGGNVMGGDKKPEDQKLERGNLALKNSMDAKSPIRVIRGDVKGSDSCDLRGKTYVYDGLYIVEKCWQEVGQHGKLVFKFKLVRIPGQPELAWRVMKSKKFKGREGVCIEDVSQGKEIIPICVINMVDEEKPMPFTYTTRMIYPSWCAPAPASGCGCLNGCTEAGNCFCVARNDGEIPYNNNGAIVEAKVLVYECGPSCKCPPSCHNRVSQLGIKFQLEIFKTESRGWGVRSLNSIPSGSFVCEYVGEILDEKEAEQRVGNDEYLFDIGNRYHDGLLWDGLPALMLPETQSSMEDAVDGHFTVDAAQFGNVGRFINHSCSPNLYAQNLLYDHHDNRIPHVMLFAAENIPPLQELTYHYNYLVNHVFDSKGNVKMKRCYCGSLECTGRLY